VTHRARGVLFVALGVLWAVLWARACFGQDTVLVELRLDGVGSRVIEATVADSVLSLAAGDVRELLGVTIPAPWVTLPELERQYPAVSWRWLPARLLLLIDDPRALLPASQAAQAALQRSAQAASAFAYRTVTGMFGALTADDSGRSQTDLGYSWRGRVVLQGSYLPAAHRGLWLASLAPIPQVSASVAGDRSVTEAALRVAAGPAFAFGTVQNGQASLDGLVALGPVALFASTRNVFVVTLARPGVSVQFARTLTQSTARFSFGPTLTASPFFVPSIPAR
jgi:hypothetical protein